MPHDRTMPTPTEVIQGIQLIRLAAKRPDADEEAAEEIIALMLKRLPRLRPDSLSDWIVAALARPKVVEVGMRLRDVVQWMEASGWKSKAQDPKHTVQVTLGRMRREGLLIHERPLWRLALHDTGGWAELEAVSRSPGPGPL